MKKRAMKKWIPKGLYCYDIVKSKNGKHMRRTCKWFKYITTIIHDENNCKYANECDNIIQGIGCENCPTNVYRCKYLNYTDWNEESLLWDSCKECGVKDE